MAWRRSATGVRPAASVSAAKSCRIVVVFCPIDHPAKVLATKHRVRGISPGRGRPHTDGQLDREAILAAAARRLLRLGKLEAAAALASSSITKVRGYNDWTTAEVFIASPHDAFDVLTQDDVYLHDHEMGDFGEPYPVWGTSRLATVFTQVLPPRMTCSDVEVKIATGRVDPNWRDEFKVQLDRGAAPPSPPTTASEAAYAAGRRTGQPGRPAWTCDRFWTRYQEALGRSDPPHTNASIAAHFEMLDGAVGIEPDYLRKLVRRFGLPPA